MAELLAVEGLCAGYGESDALVAPGHDFETVTEALYANHEWRVDYQNAQGERGKEAQDHAGIRQDTQCTRHTSS